MPYNPPPSSRFRAMRSSPTRMGSATQAKSAVPQDVVGSDHRAGIAILSNHRSRNLVCWSTRSRNRQCLWRRHRVTVWRAIVAWERLRIEPKPLLGWRAPAATADSVGGALFSSGRRCVKKRVGLGVVITMFIVWSDVWASFSAGQRTSSRGV
jgi:hypothetical protein